MTVEEAFRFGFLKECADSGIHPEVAALMLDRVEERPVKTASLAELPYKAMIATMLAGMGTSGAMGYLAGRTTSPPFNAQDARDEELAETYRQNTDRLRLARMGRVRSSGLMQPRV